MSGESGLPASLKMSALILPGVPMACVAMEGRWKERRGVNERKQK